MTLILVLLTAISWLFLSGQKNVPVTKNISYGTGEELEYRVNLSIFTVGKAVTRVDRKYHEVNSRTCYKVDAYGETSDWISFVVKVNDNWGAFVDTASLVTHQAWRKLKEGKYQRDEVVNFDQANDKVEVKVRNTKTGEYDPPLVFNVPHNATDLVGGFLFLRIVDFSKVQRGDTITLSGFLEKESYNLKIIYSGKEVVHTRIGKIPCLKLRPVMPKNSMFDGENSIACWISDDLNRIPVKLQAKMFIGNTGLELIRFRGLRNQIKVLP